MTCIDREGYVYTRVGADAGSGSICQIVATKANVEQSDARIMSDTVAMPMINVEITIAACATIRQWAMKSLAW